MTSKTSSSGGGRRKSGRLLDPALVKFLLVGGIGVAVNEGLLIALESVGVYYLTAGGIAIELSILSNFVLNDLWTFKDRRTGRAIVRLVKFNVLMLAGAVLNLVVLDVGTTYLGMSAEVANLVGIAAAFVLRYVLSIKYAWMSTESIETGQTPEVSGSPRQGPSP